MVKRRNNERAKGERRKRTMLKKRQRSFARGVPMDNRGKAQKKNGGPRIPKKQGKTWVPDKVPLHLMKSKRDGAAKANIVVAQALSGVSATAPSATAPSATSATKE
jgi:hypothetical protein